MALLTGDFYGRIGGKSMNDYSFLLDFDLDTFDERLKLLNNVLNLDENGLSKDEFWMDIWDIAKLKVNLNTTDSLWSDSNIAQSIELMGTYLLSQEKVDNKRYHRGKETDYDSCGEEYLSESVNDKNYRLAPPESIKDADYEYREPFKYDYSYYKDIVYEKYLNGLKSKIAKDNESRYGHHDGKFEEFACGKLMSEDTWENIKRLETEKIKLLKDARDNIRILRNQHRLIKDGNYVYNKGLYDTIDNKIEYEFKTNEKVGNKNRNLYSPNYITDVIKKIEVNKCKFIDRIIPCSEQLYRSGYNNDEIKLIEETSLHGKVNKDLKLNMKSVNSNIASIKDYMIQVKLAYNNRICISPDKNKAVMDILEHVDYDNEKHIEGVLYMQGLDISYENDMSIISYDINKCITELIEFGKLDDKDVYIIEGIRHNITQEELGLELGMSKQGINKRISAICKKIKKYL